MEQLDAIQKAINCYVLHVLNQLMPLGCISIISAIRCVFWHLCAYLYSFILFNLCIRVHLSINKSTTSFLFQLYSLFTSNLFLQSSHSKGQKQCEKKPRYTVHLVTKDLTKVSSQEFGSYFPRAMQLYGNRRQRHAGQDKVK